MIRRNLGKASAYLLTGALLLSGAAVSVATGPSVGATATSNSSNIITISNYIFAPMVLRVAPGATIKVINGDNVVHSVDDNSGLFNTGNIFPGKTKSFKAPKKPGRYHYFCAVHTFMKATIVVK
jgi:plastocyanin